MSKHTPGPWRVVDDHPSRAALYVRAGRYGAYADEVATVYTSVDSCDADAHLLAAAPELLEALERLLEFADNGTPIYPGSLAMDDARAAIAKAKGEK